MMFKFIEEWKKLFPSDVLTIKKMHVLVGILYKEHEAKVNTKGNNTLSNLITTGDSSTINLADNLLMENPWKSKRFECVDC